MSRTAREIAELLGVTLEGDGRVEITGMAGPERAGAGDLIYVDAAKHLTRAAQSAARCVIVAREAELPGKTLLRAPNPKLAFARAAQWLLPQAEAAAGVHATAIVSASAKLGKGTSVGPYAVIEEDAEIGSGSHVGPHCVIGRAAQVGADCRLHARVTLYAGVKMGSRVVVHSGAVIGSDGFGYVYDEGRYLKFPQAGSVEIGDDVEIGSNTTIDRGSLDTTRIGAGVKIDNLVQVAHNVQIGPNTVIAAQTGISGSSVIGRNVVIGGQVGIADHCRVEDGAILGAQAGIPTGKTIHGGQTVWGTPARPLDRFKQQYVWFSRLPDLAERLHKLEEVLAKK